MTQAFPGMDKQSSVFYSRIFATAMLNMHAVQMGLYPTYICEMEHPLQALHWNENMVSVLQAFKQRRARDMEDDDGR